MLTDLAKKKKGLWQKWVSGGKKRGDDESFVKLKEAKKAFRKQHKEAEQEMERKMMQEICECQQVDQKCFWYLVGRKKKKVNS